MGPSTPASGFTPKGKDPPTGIAAAGVAREVGEKTGEVIGRLPTRSGVGNGATVGTDHMGEVVPKSPSTIRFSPLESEDGLHHVAGRLRGKLRRHEPERAADRRAERLQLLLHVLQIAGHRLNQLLNLMELDELLLLEVLQLLKLLRDDLQELHRVRPELCPAGAEAPDRLSRELLWVLLLRERLNAERPDSEWCRGE